MFLKCGNVTYYMHSAMETATHFYFTTPKDPNAMLKKPKQESRRVQKRRCYHKRVEGKERSFESLYC